METNLVKALELESETLQNITDQFAPLMADFRIFFFWEQERTDLKARKDYIVEETSAAPILDNTERCGIAADHQRMCKFETNSSQGFRTAVAALQRYAHEAPEVIRCRVIKASQVLSEKKRNEAMELLRGTGTGTGTQALLPVGAFALEGTGTGTTAATTAATVHIGRIEDSMILREGGLDSREIIEDSR